MGRKRGWLRSPVDAGKKGGWNLFVAIATALDASTSLTNSYPTTPCPNDVAGFICDEELQRRRRSRWESTDKAERAKLADKIQERAYPGVAVHQRRAVEVVHGGTDERDLGG